jgi:hypothetical protein
MAKRSAAPKIAALAVAALLGGCAGEQGPPPLTALPVHDCAAAPDLSKAAALVLDPKDDTERIVDIAAATPCVKTASGDALYVVYSLPQTSAPYVIGVASPAMGATLFAPHVMLLAADGTVKREYSGDQLEFHGDGLGVRVRNHGDEAYLVIASDPGAVGRSTTRINEATRVGYGSTGTATFEIHTGSESRDTYTYAHNGRVTVTLTPIAPSK